MEDYYTPGQAARVLRYSERHVRKLLADGDLEGERDASGRWRIYRHSVHAMLPDRGARVEHPPEPPGSPERARELEDRVEDLYGRIEALAHDLGRAQARAELTELAHSTLKEERDRLLSDIEREREERRQAHDEAARLRDELEAERSKGFWRRLFGRGP